MISFQVLDTDEKILSTTAHELVSVSVRSSLAHLRRVGGFPFFNAD